MGEDKIVEMLIRMDEKLNTLVATDNDHETRIRLLEQKEPDGDHETRLRELEKNDLGRFIPMAIGLLTLVSLAIALLK